MEGGRNFTQAFIRNVRGCLLMRGKHSARIPERKTGDLESEMEGSDGSSIPIKLGEATSGVGLSHSSEEILVMRMERRA
jgi:hypothetical protein